MGTGAVALPWAGAGTSAAAAAAGKRGRPVTPHGSAGAAVAGRERPPPSPPPRTIGRGRGEAVRTITTGSCVFARVGTAHLVAGTAEGGLMASDASTLRTIETNIPARMDRLPWSKWHWMVVFGLVTV